MQERNPVLIVCPLLLLAFSTYGFWDMVYGPGRLTINCPNHCQHPNIFIKGYTYVYLAGLGVSMEWMLMAFTAFRSSTTPPYVEAVSRWLALSVMNFTTALAFVVFFILGYDFNTVDNYLCAILIPATLLTHLALIQRIPSMTARMATIPFKEQLGYVLWLVIIIVVAVLWNFRLAAHKFEFTLMPGEHLVTYGFSYQYTSSGLSPNFGQVVSLPFNNTSETPMRFVGVKAMERTILDDNVSLTRYLAVAIFFLFPGCTYAMLRLLGWFPADYTFDGAVVDIVEQLKSKLIMLTFPIIVVMRVPVNQLVNYLFYVTYILGFCTPLYLYAQDRFADLAPYIATMNPVTFFLAQQWVDTDYSGTWLHDAQPVLTMLLVLVDKKFAEDVTRPSFVRTSWLVMLMLGVYSGMTQVHMYLYGTTPYGSVVSPPADEPISWLSIYPAILTTNLVVRVVSLQQQNIAISFTNLMASEKQRRVIEQEPSVAYFMRDVRVLDVLLAVMIAIVPFLVWLALDNYQSLLLLVAIGVPLLLLLVVALVVWSLNKQGDPRVAVLRRTISPMLVLIACTAALLWNTFSDQRNCDLICGHPNLFLNPYPLLYVIAIGIAFEHLANTKSELELMSDWLALSLGVLIPDQLVFFLVTGTNPMVNLNFWMLTLVLPPLVVLHLRLNFYHQERFSAITYSDIFYRWSWIPLICYTMFEWHTSNASHVWEMSMQDDAGGSWSLQMQYDYSDTDEFGPNDGVLRTQQFLCNGTCTIADVDMTVQSNSGPIAWINPSRIRLANDTAAFSLWILGPLTVFAINQNLLRPKLRIPEGTNVIHTLVDIVSRQMCILTAMFLGAYVKFGPPMIPMFSTLTRPHYILFMVSAYYWNWRKPTTLASPILVASLMQVGYSIAFLHQDEEYVIGSGPSLVQVADFTAFMGIVFSIVDTRIHAHILGDSFGTSVAMVVFMISFQAINTDVHIRLYNRSNMLGDSIGSPMQEFGTWLGILLFGLLLLTLTRAVLFLTYKLPLRAFSSRHPLPTMASSTMVPVAA